MSALLTEVDALRQQLAEKEAMIEQQKREAREKEEESWEFNMDVLEKIYKSQKRAKEVRIHNIDCDIKNYMKHLKRTGYNGNPLPPSIVALESRKKSLTSSYPSQMATYHLFKRLDERLTHIERFLIDDIKKEEFLENKKSPVQWEKAAEKSADALIATMSTC